MLFAGKFGGLGSFRRGFVAAVSFFFVFTGGAARGTGAANEITVAYLPWAAPSGEARLAIIPIERFRREHPGVEVLQFQSLSLPGPFFTATRIMGLASSSGPDALFGADIWLGTYVRSGLVQPIDDLMEEWPGAKNVPASWRDSMKIGGKEWAIPDRLYTRFIGFSRQACAAAGVKEKDMPASWDALARLVARLTTGGRAGFIMMKGDLSDLWMALVRQAGEEPYTMDSRGRLHVPFDSPAGVRAAELLADWGAKVRAAGGRIEISSENWAVPTAIMAGKAAGGLLFTPDLNWNSGAGPFWTTSPFLVSVPGGFSPEPLSWIGSNDRVWMMPSYLKGEKRKLVWQYITAINLSDPRYDDDHAEVFPGATDPINLTLLMRDPRSSRLPPIPPAWVPLFSKIGQTTTASHLYLDGAQANVLLDELIIKLLNVGGDARAMLVEARNTYEREALGIDPDKQLGKYTGPVILSLLAAALLASLGYLGAMLAGEIRRVRGIPSGGAIRREIPFVLFMFLPGLALSVVFAAVPLFNGLRISLHEGVLRGGGSFVGLANYMDVMSNTTTRMALWNTARYIGWSFLFAFLAPLVLSVLMLGFRRFQGMVRGAYFLPAVANAVVVALMWEQLFAQNGLVNVFVGIMGFPPQDWLGNPKLAMASMVFAQSWAMLGISGLVYLAGLSTIPESLYEEATMAGASLWERFTVVTFPFLRPLVGVSFVGWLLSTARTAEHVMLMTAGGPEQATYVFGLDIFKRAYIDVKMGFAMAEVWLLMAVILVLAIFQMRSIRAQQGRVA